MRFIHIGDLHLGKSIGEFDLIDDQKYVLDKVIELAKEESVDGLLIAGDIFDKSIPSEAAVRLLDSFLSELVSNHINVYMISGNHDSDERLNYGSSLFTSNNIYISTKFEGTLYKQSLSDETADVDIYMLPFVKASQVRHYYPDESIETYDDAIKTVIKNTEIDKNKTNILIAHQFVAGKGMDPVLAGSEGLGTISVGLVEKIGYDSFNDFDYVALGHIHSPQRVGRDNIRYSGSIIKYSLSEAHNDKSIPLISIDDNDINIDLIPIKPMRDVRHIRGKMADLLDKKNITDTDDFIYATLTDEDIINNAMAVFQQTYPNTVKIDYDNSHTREIEEIDISRIVKDRTFEELISDFYMQIYSQKISDEEMDILREVAKETGVIHEAD